MNKYQDLHASDVPAARLVAGLKYQKAPENLASQVMSRIASSTEVKKISLFQWLFAPRAIHLAPIWPIAAALLVVSALTFLPIEPFQMEQKLQLSTAQHSDETFYVLFSFKNPDVDSVSIMGTFNEWNPSEHVMSQSENGTWTITISLPEGNHEYAFLINDEQIVPDQDALLFKDDGFGNLNSMIVIEDPGYAQQT